MATTTVFQCYLLAFYLSSIVCFSSSSIYNGHSNTLIKWHRLFDRKASLTLHVITLKWRFIFDNVVGRPMRCHYDTRKKCACCAILSAEKIFSKKNRVYDKLNIFNNKLCSFTVMIHLYGINFINYSKKIIIIMIICFRFLKFYKYY